ncbi:5'/3'-nucleotidase SurE [Streptomyces sp. RKAG337]|uniref:5'/3'-nucleotidase SurE n=1 Tax=Streptomyces sp. RKAG337 TaxID=2893404 RepID=UPI00203333E8|nr:5'/3'-nucleotidase SurE [Streptomyces sp. RKAG337]MCM2430495.1 5'/3'-nucleotidase SurE [Streptomyces sp. RKAG337]
MRRQHVLSSAALLLCLSAVSVTLPAAAAQPAASSGPLRILLTNDDGYNAPGIRAEYDRLTAAGHQVTIVAPLQNQSGAGTKMMSATSVVVQHPEAQVWAVDGTPGDAVAFGLSQVFADRAPDLVISGTNFGTNVAGFATHSGTVGGAIAALERGIPAIAVSTGSFSVPAPGPTLNAMRVTADFTVKLIDRLQARAKSGRLLPDGVGLNVNHPIVGADGTGTARGVSLTFQDAQTVLTPHYTDAGDGTWKVTVSFDPLAPAKGSDVAAVNADKVSIAPMNADWNSGPADFAAATALLAGLRP